MLNSRGVLVAHLFLMLSSLALILHILFLFCGSSFGFVLGLF